MSARTILKHLHQQGRMTDYQFNVINRNLRERPQGECSTCIYDGVSSVEAPCSQCCHAWNDMYEEAENEN